MMPDEHSEREEPRHAIYLSEVRAYFTSVVFTAKFHTGVAHALHPHSLFSGLTADEEFVTDFLHSHTVLCLDLVKSCQCDGINIYTDHKV